MENSKAKRAFLSHPVSDFVGSDGTFRPEKREFVAKAIKVLNGEGYEILCAALHENYGSIKLEPIDFTLYDVESIEDSDLFVLIASERVSRDMYLEIGLALGLGIPILMFVPFSARITYMIYGLEKLGKLNVVRYDSEKVLPDLIGNVVRELSASRSSVPALQEEVHWRPSR